VAYRSLGLAYIGLLVLIGVLLLVWEPERKQRETVDATVGSFPWKTAALVSAGTLMGIEVLDHLVLGAGRYVSFKDRGLI